MSARSRCPPGLLKDLCTVFLSSSPGGVLALVTEKGSRVTAGTHRLPFGKASLREPNPTGVILRVFFSSCLRIAVAGTSVRDSGSPAPGGVSGGMGTFGSPRAPSWGLRGAEQRDRRGGLSPLMTAL